MSEQMLSAARVAQRLGLSKKTLTNRRALGKPPMFVKTAPHQQARVLYPLAAVVDFERSRHSRD